MYSDDKLILQLLSLMKQYGIRHVVVSPGSRHFPLVHSMESDDYFTLYSVVDERSAAFFALGVIQKTNEPVAVCCTSGTSAINYGSAVVEAFYQGLPLVVLTADRLPELLGQKEEQMFPQERVFHGFVKYHGQLKEAKDSLSEWYSNRIINEAFLELNHHGRGPVHLNIPIERHHLDKFQTPTLPKARKISRIQADADPEIFARCADQLKNKKVMILWGQAPAMDARLRSAVDQFAEAFDCVILADRLSNCRHPRSIESAYLSLRSMNEAQTASLLPDVVISLFGNYTYNGEIKNYLKRTGPAFEHWDVGTASVSDPFWKLTKLFEMNEAFFFRALAEQAGHKASSAYHDGWLEVDQALAEPQVDFGEIYSVGSLMRNLPENSVLQIANSLPIRMTHLFRSRPITSFCNRGVNGIDGCMSTAVGYAAATDEPVFLVIGDLTFFYDMNALWNRHLSKNLRILLLNNEGGGVMHVPLSPDLAPILHRHVSAGHVTSAKGWAESLGIRYLTATTAQECDEAISILTNPDEPGPIIVEAFSKKEQDVLEFKSFLKRKREPVTLARKIKRKIRRVSDKMTSIVS